MRSATSNLEPEARRAFRRRLLRWFDQKQRDLPWRADRDPYHVWISEIMLQQTRVAVVRERYRDFLQRFPAVERLAAAELPQVLAAWSGLGYYRRARALHAAARQIKTSRAFPHTADELAQLPGIGRYTAAAIASIAFGEPRAVVDGNVERVLARLFRMRKHDAWTVAAELLSPRRPGDSNQAMMELGATVCLPATPLCDKCPVVRWCRTRGRTSSRPAARRRRAEIAYALAVRRDSVLLVQRSDGESLMPGMWELPRTAVDGAKPLLRLKHAITNTDYRVSVYRVRAHQSRGRWVKVTEAANLPLTGLTQKIIRQLCKALRW